MFRMRASFLFGKNTRTFFNPAGIPQYLSNIKQNNSTPDNTQNALVLNGMDRDMMFYRGLPLKARAAVQLREWIIRQFYPEGHEDPWLHQREKQLPMKFFSWVKEVIGNNKFYLSKHNNEWLTLIFLISMRKNNAELMYLISYHLRRANPKINLLDCWLSIFDTFFGKNPDALIPILRDNGASEVLKYFLYIGGHCFSYIDPDYTSTFELRPRQAYHEGHLEILEILLKEHVVAQSIIGPDKDSKRVPLHQIMSSCKNEKILLRAVNLFLRNGTDPNDKDEFGNNALHEAARHGHARVAHYLLHNPYTKIQNINEKNGDGDNAACVLLKTKRENIKFLQFLIDHGIDTNRINKAGLSFSLDDSNNFDFFDEDQIKNRLVQYDEKINNELAKKGASCASTHLFTEVKLPREIEAFIGWYVDTFIKTHIRSDLSIATTRGELENIVDPRQRIFTLITRERQSLLYSLKTVLKTVYYCRCRYEYESNETPNVLHHSDFESVDKLADLAPKNRTPC
jgi:hypothetical protein